MKSKSILCAVAALAMGVSGVAFAQDNKDVRADRAGRGDHDVRVPQRGDRGDHGRGNDQRGPGWDRGNDHRGPGWDRGHDNRSSDRYRPGPGPRYGDGRGAGPEHNFYRGGRLPPQWRSRQYVVDDWRGHRLSAPPRGYHWVQAGGDYVLVAITTGIIASILLNQ